VPTHTTLMTAPPALDGAHAMWSMWSGYLDEPSGTKLRAWLEDRGIGLTVVHSSGHATTADLQRFASAINAKELVPVHTRQSGRYGELFSNVRQHADGDWWNV
jgi:ribonuclease J